MKRRKASNAVRTALRALPAGFTQVSGGTFAPSWDPKIGDALQGVVMAKRVLDAKTVGRKKAKKGDKVVVLDIADADGVIHAVWESRALESFCKEVTPGAEVYLRLDDVKKLGAKRFKVFTVATKAKGGRK